jgi:guanylate kinase
MSLIIISGPSGVGKGTLINAVQQARPGLHVAVSATTRPQRRGEVAGRDYHFVSEADFVQLREQGKLLEQAQYAGHWYGTLIDEIVGPTLIECDIRGRAEIVSRVPAISVFLEPPSLEILAQRLRGRGTETAAQIAARLARAEAELRAGDQYDYRLVVTDLISATAKLVTIIDQIQLRPAIQTN